MGTNGVCHRYTISDRPWSVTGPATFTVTLRPCSVAMKRSGRQTGYATVTFLWDHALFSVKEEVRWTDGIFYRYCLCESTIHNKEGGLTGPSTVTVSEITHCVARERSAGLTEPATGTVFVRPCFMTLEVRWTATDIVDVRPHSVTRERSGGLNTVSDRPWYVTGPVATARPCSVATESLGRLTGSATVTVTVRHALWQRGGQVDRRGM